MENDLEKQLRSVLNDPSAMREIMAMAQSLSGTKSASSGESDKMPMERLVGIAANSGIDQQQRSLLAALSPYLSNDRIRKLENAMRAAKMTRLATSLFSGSR